MAVVERSVETVRRIGAVLMDILKIASRLKEPTRRAVGTRRASSSGSSRNADRPDDT